MSYDSYPFKVACMTTVSLKYILDLFKDKIIEIKAQASIIKEKPVRFSEILKEKLGANFLVTNKNSLILKYNNQIHDNLTSVNIKRLLDTMDLLNIDDAAIQKLVIQIKDRKLGKICREALTDVNEFIEKPEMPLIKRIPKDEKLFQISFFADPCEKEILEDEDARRYLYKPENLKYFVLNLKKLINEWQIRNLPKKINRHLPHLPPKLNLIDIEDWNWKANFLPKSYYSAAPIVDYIKEHYLGKYKLEKSFGMTQDNKIILSKFGR